MREESWPTGASELRCYAGSPRSSTDRDARPLASRLSTEVKSQRYVRERRDICFIKVREGLGGRIFRAEGENASRRTFEFFVIGFTGGDGIKEAREKGKDF